MAGPRFIAEIGIEGGIDAFVDSPSIAQTCRLGADLEHRRARLIEDFERTLDHVIELLRDDCRQAIPDELLRRPA